MTARPDDEERRVLEDPMTIGELGRLLRALTDQVRDLTEEVKHQGESWRIQFTGLDDRFVRKDLHSRDVAEMHGRQDLYQGQTDRMLEGFEDEVRQVRKAAADDKKDRDAELDRIATQRHNDHVIYGVAVLTAFVLPLLLALATGAWNP